MSKLRGRMLKKKFRLLIVQVNKSRMKISSGLISVAFDSLFYELV